MGEKLYPFCDFTPWGLCARENEEQWAVIADAEADTDYKAALEEGTLDSVEARRTEGDRLRRIAAQTRVEAIFCDHCPLKVDLNPNKPVP